MENKSSCIFFLGVIALLGICGSFLFCMPQKSFSETENRYLTTLQKESISTFIDTSFQNNLTDMANDQFIERDIWVKLSVSLQRAIGLCDINGTYLGKDGYYFERILDSPLSENRYQNNLRFLEQFSAKSQTNVTFLPVPSASTIMTDKLPKNAVLYNAKNLYKQAENGLKNAKLLDIRPDMAKSCKSNQIYFKTDHHWTMEGAYVGYAAWCKLHKISPKALEWFSPKKVSKEFYGTLYSKAPVFSAEPDIFMLPVKFPKTETLINEKKIDMFSDTKAYKYGIYDWSKLKVKDKYSVYFGGNFGRIDNYINNNSNKKLLIIKDSFANSIIPFLAEHYQTITMLDFRYYNDSVIKLMQSEQFDEILILYEISNFAQDMNFFKILK